jgi:hypothetical protein
MEKPELLDALITTKSVTLNYFDLPGSDLSKTYGTGKWSIRQILHHLTDTEYLFHGRLKKIIAEPRQVIWAFNQDDWAKAFDYITEPLDGKKNIYSLFRDLNYELISKYYDDFREKEFVHNESGLRTLKLEFGKVALHNLNHNEQIRTALINGER